MTIDIAFELLQVAGKQDTGSEIRQYVGRNWMSTARYLLWGTDTVSGCE